MNNILGKVCRELTLRHFIVHNPEMFDHDLRRFVAENRVDFLSFDNADYEYVKHLDDFVGFHVIRDPRDICVSAYYSHLYSHRITRPELAEHRAKLQALSKDDGLLYEMQSRKRQFERMYNWPSSLPTVLEVRMEELIQNPYQSLPEILGYLGLLYDATFSTKSRLVYCLHRGLRRLEDAGPGHLSIPIAPERLHVERLLGIIWENDFTVKSGGRQPGQEDPRSHYRKGTPGDWKNHFQEMHIDYFSSHYNHVLLKLGYEQDPDWAMHYVERERA
jgi:hypothetical protein